MGSDKAAGERTGGVHYEKKTGSEPVVITSIISDVNVAQFKTQVSVDLSGRAD